MIRNALIAIYILAVLAISAVSRAESITSSRVLFKPKHPVNSANTLLGQRTPSPDTANAEFPAMKMLSIGNRGASK